MRYRKKWYEKLYERIRIFISINIMNHVWKFVRDFQIEWFDMMESMYLGISKFTVARAEHYSNKVNKILDLYVEEIEILEAEEDGRTK